MATLMALAENLMSIDIKYLIEETKACKKTFSDTTDVCVKPAVLRVSILQTYRIYLQRTVT